MGAQGPVNKEETEFWSEQANSSFVTPFAKYLHPRSAQLFH